MPITAVRNLERVCSEDLLVGEPVGSSSNKYDIVRLYPAHVDMQFVTPFRQGTFGNPKYRHIYQKARDERVLLNVHCALNEVTTGETSRPRIDSDLWIIAGKFKRELPESNLETQTNELRATYLDELEINRNKTAQSMSRAFLRREVYVCTSYQGSIYAAKVSGVVNIRDEEKTAFEPVVETPAGVGLLPEKSYIFQGLYVPTVEQELEGIL